MEGLKEGRGKERDGERETRSGGKCLKPKANRCLLVFMFGFEFSVLLARLARLRRSMHLTPTKNAVFWRRVDVSSIR